MAGKRNSYTAKFKLQVIAFSESTNNSMAARYFSINEKLVRLEEKAKSFIQDAEE